MIYSKSERKINLMTENTVYVLQKKIWSFPDIQKLKEFGTTKLTLQKMLKKLCKDEVRLLICNRRTYESISFTSKVKYRNSKCCNGGGLITYTPSIKFKR